VSELTWYIGIDPGLTGAIAALAIQTTNTSNVLPGSLKVWDMPLVAHKKKSTVDGMGVAEIFRKIGPHCALYEDVSAMVYVDASGNRRGQGSASSFAFGKSLGIVIGVGQALNVPMRSVHASIWKSLLGLSASKLASLELAKATFAQHTQYFERKKDDGRAEAALLAYFAATRLGGLSGDSRS
jgi:hypothetical protein